MSRYRIRDYQRVETSILLDDGDHLRIDPHGILSWVGQGSPIVLTGGTISIRHAGEVTSYGLAPAITGLLTSDFDIRIVTTASLPTFGAPSIALASAEGVSGALHIRNSAGLHGGSGFAGGVDLSALHADTVGLVNNGLIGSVEGGPSYIGSDGHDVVRNSGTLSSDTHLGAGDDILRNTGSIGLKILAGAGDDRLFVGSGSALIWGGSGRDVIWSDAGNKGYFFDALSDSAPDRAQADVIHNYDRATGDFIVLSAIDADTTLEGDQAFRFVGTTAFSGQAGELRCDLLRNGGAVVYADVDGDLQADFALVVRGEVHAPTDLDFGL